MRRSKGVPRASRGWAGEPCTPFYCDGSMAKALSPASFITFYSSVALEISIVSPSFNSGPSSKPTNIFSMRKAQSMVQSTVQSIVNSPGFVVSPFLGIKEALATATLLAHPKPDALTSVMTDASDIAVGGVLQQYIDGHWHPISYFSRKLKPAERRYSTFDRELLAVYLSIKHFRYFLEGRCFHVVTDHKPLIYTFSARADRHSPRQARHLDYISQFTTDLRHTRGIDNPVADALSRIEANAIMHASAPLIDYHTMAKAQQTDTELTRLLVLFPQASRSSTPYCRHGHYL